MKYAKSHKGLILTFKKLEFTLLHTISDEYWPINKKMNWFEYGNYVPFCMNILNDIACKLNWTEFSNSTQFNSMIGLKLNSIEEKQDANLWKRSLKSTHEYGVGKKKLEMKRQFFMQFIGE